ncbi:MAG TPA: hypothetical protein P5013_08895 [Methanoregula sp.]|nr:hypothetical protein [Methanoregula sp.]
MKGYSYVLAILLLSCILSTGCMELGMSGFGWVFDVQEPLGSVCTSPAARLARSSAGLDLDHCFQQVAVNTGNIPLCDKVERGAPKTKCYLLIASRQNDLHICDQVPETNDFQAYLKVDCLWEVAIKNNNRDACIAMGTDKLSRMFVGEMSQQTCLARLASGQGVGVSTI